jgi:hypothetical protein
MVVPMLGYVHRHMARHVRHGGGPGLLEGARKCRGRPADHGEGNQHDQEAPRESQHNAHYTLRGLDSKGRARSLVPPDNWSAGCPLCTRLRSRPGKYLDFRKLHKDKVKAFFFEKKKQKTFMSLGRCWGNVRDSE